MIKNKQRLTRFYQKLMREEKIPYKKALLIYEALYREAVALGRINRKNILEGLEVDIRMAKIINGLTK